MQCSIITYSVQGSNILQYRAVTCSYIQGFRQMLTNVFLAIAQSEHSGVSHSHTMYVISSAVKHCNFKLTSQLPARNTLQVIKQHSLKGNTQAMRKHSQTLQTVNFLEGKTPFCIVCTQWQGNTLAKNVQFHCSRSANKQMLF